MPEFDSRAAARKAAVARLHQLSTEKAAILATFPELRLPAGTRRGSRPERHDTRRVRVAERRSSA